MINNFSCEGASIAKMFDISKAPSLAKVVASQIDDKEFTIGTQSLTLSSEV